MPPTGSLIANTKSLVAKIKFLHFVFAIVSAGGGIPEVAVLNVKHKIKTLNVFISPVGEILYQTTHLNP